MKKMISLLLVLLLALGCAAGCGDDEKENEDKDAKALTIADVNQTMSKLSEGMAFEMSFSVNIKPSFEEGTVTKEEFEAVLGSFMEAKLDGSYELSLLMKGESDMEGRTMEIFLKNEPFTDMIQKDEKMYVNVKTLFELIVKIAGAAMGEESSIYADMLKWPYENEYIEASQFTEQLGGLSGAILPDMGAILPGLDGGISGDAGASMDLAELEALGASILEALPMEETEAFLNKIASEMSDANEFRAEFEEIELRLDNSNVAAVVTNLCGVLRTDLADYMETLASSLKDVESLPEEAKQLFSQFDKAAFQEELDAALEEEALKEAAAELEQALENAHFYFTVEATDTSCAFSADIQIPVTESGASELPITQAGFAYEFRFEEKTIGEIQAPDAVLTEEELQSFLELFFGEDVSGIAAA